MELKETKKQTRAMQVEERVLLLVEEIVNQHLHMQPLQPGPTKHPHNVSKQRSRANSHHSKAHTSSSSSQKQKQKSSSSSNVNEPQQEVQIEIPEDSGSPTM